MSERPAEAAPIETPPEPAAEPKDPSIAFRQDPEYIRIIQRVEDGQRISNKEFLYVREWARIVPGWPGDAEPLYPIDNRLMRDLWNFQQAFSNYYKKPYYQVYTALGESFARAVYTATPEIIAASALHRINWQSHLLQATKMTLWMLLVGKYEPTSGMSDPDFRRWFELEWERLMDWRGLQNDFLVIPRFPLSDMERYQKLPNGNREIRQMISSYLAHQAKVYPQIIAPWAPLFRQKVFGDRLGRLYEPLITKTASRAVRFLETTTSFGRDSTLKLPPADRLKRLNSMVEEVWKEYDRAWDNFEYFVPYNGETPRRTSIEILGLAESENERRIFDRFLRAGGDELLGLKSAADKKETVATDLTPILFCRYLMRRLTNWILNNYPPPKREPRTLSTDAPGQSKDVASTHSIDALQYMHEEPAVKDLEGNDYYTVEQAARRYGRSVRQLRYADNVGHVPTLRAGDVKTPLFVSGGQKPSSSLRLYPDTPEFDEKMRLWIARSDVRASKLAADEITRTVAAKLLGVSIDKLRGLETSGKVTVTAKGRSVVYTPKAIEQARMALKC